MFGGQWAEGGEQTMKWNAAAIAALMAILSTSNGGAATAPQPAPGLLVCYDVRKAEPHWLTGRLSYQIFPGPPGYEDIQKGDEPEGAYILTLTQPICIVDGDGFADPAEHFNTVHLVPTSKTKGRMAALKNSDVSVTLDKQMASENGHHHAPLVAWVTEVAPAPAMTAEFGTAATTIRAFYLALEAGDGITAAKFVVPEKRQTGPLSSTAMTAFYGMLVEPLHLTALTRLAENKYAVSYHFTSGRGVCDGRAEVTTTKRHGADFIKSIHAFNGC